MAPTQLRCRDLRAGDVMLQESLGNLPGKLIAFGQFVTGHQHTGIIHAGIMFDSTYIVEALGSGIAANDLRVKDKGCGYLVFRPRNPALGTIAGNLAKFLLDEHFMTKKLTYAPFGAAASIGAPKPAKSSAELDALMDDILAAKPSSMFCSQFVVITYQIAAGQLGHAPKSVLPLGDGRVAPARLASALEQSSWFTNVGYMKPNER